MKQYSPDHLAWSVYCKASNNYTCKIYSFSLLGKLIIMYCMFIWSMHALFSLQYVYNYNPSNLPVSGPSSLPTWPCSRACRRCLHDILALILLPQYMLPPICCRYILMYSPVWQSSRLNTTFIPVPLQLWRCVSLLCACAAYSRYSCVFVCTRLISFSLPKEELKTFINASYMISLVVLQIRQDSLASVRSLAVNFKVYRLSA